MKTVFSTISLLTAVALVVPGAAGLCGPNSNCQIVEQDGIRKYKLRPGAQPVEVKELPAGGSASGSTAGLQVNVIVCNPHIPPYLLRTYLVSISMPLRHFAN